MLSENILAQIIKQLQKDSISWTEGDNGEILLLQVDMIDPNGLSFNKKK